MYGGWQDYRDALGCWMRFRENLDRKYLTKVCQQLQLQKELELLTSGIEDPDNYFEKING